ncbi:MAG: nuclear transport factor 2 family protein [Phenylobacterium sp.]
MPERDRVAAFVATVEAGRYVEAIEQFYHPDASMQDNQREPRVGRDRLIADERATMARFAAMHTDPVEDLLIDGDKVMVRWRFVFTPADGDPITMEELALQRWDGERIAEERFFYDPGQTRPAPTVG